MKKSLIKTKVYRKYTEYKIFIWIVSIIILFPLIIGFLYFLPLPQVINLNSGDLLAFYGTAFGILGSFLMYRYEIDKKEEERDKKLRPQLTINLKREQGDDDIFILTINKNPKQMLNYLYVYEVFINETMRMKTELRIAFNKTDEEARRFKLDCNICVVNDDKFDNDGYPEYVQIMCTDMDNHIWNSDFERIVEYDRIYYGLEDRYRIT